MVVHAAPTSLRIHDSQQQLGRRRRWNGKSLPVRSAGAWATQQHGGGSGVAVAVAAAVSVGASRSLTDVARRRRCASRAAKAGETAPFH